MTTKTSPTRRPAPPAAPQLPEGLRARKPGQAPVGEPVAPQPAAQAPSDLEQAVAGIIQPRDKGRETVAFGGKVDRQTHDRFKRAAVLARRPMQSMLREAMELLAAKIEAEHNLR